METGMGTDGIPGRVIDLADTFVGRTNPAMKWMWGPALLGYALTELDSFLGGDRYFAFTKAYCDHYAGRCPRVDQSDTAAPALVTHAMYLRTGNPDYKKLTDRVLSYIRTAPRIEGEIVNHLGNSPEGRFYPRSAWVDSLMMFAVFPAVYAAGSDDGELLDYAARQPAVYARLLRDPSTGLWHHSYRVKTRRPYPRNIFWARGNGWVEVSLPLILDRLPAGHPERNAITEIFRETSEALLGYRRKDGYFETVLNAPGRTYRESSATALIAAGWLHGVRCGYLDERFRAPAIGSFEALVENLSVRNGETFMGEISGPTIPLPVFPFPGYSMVQRRENRTYGIAALIFAALEYGKLQRSRQT